MACTSTNRRIVSGGGEGQVRVWDVTKAGITSMKEAMKEHKGSITCIKITASDEEVYAETHISHEFHYNLFF